MYIMSVPLSEKEFCKACLQRTINNTVFEHLSRPQQNLLENDLWKFLKQLWILNCYTNSMTKKWWNVQV